MLLRRMMEKTNFMALADYEKLVSLINFWENRYSMMQGTIHRVIQNLADDANGQILNHSVYKDKIERGLSYGRCKEI